MEATTFFVPETDCFRYYLVNQYDGVNTAIKNAKRRMDGFREGKDVPSEYDPGTTVYKVVEELMGYLEE